MGTESDVIQVIREHFNRPDVFLEEDLRNDYYGDSIDIMELGLVLEETFGIEIDDDNFMGVRTVKDVVEKTADIIHMGSA